MAYKLEREKPNYLELDVNGDILRINVGGMALYKKVIEAQSRLRDIQQKIDLFTEKGKEITPELVQFLGEAVLYMFSVSFGEANAQKILDFYEGNYDEMLAKVYPFFVSEFVPALKQSAREDSKNYARKLAGTP